MGGASRYAWVVGGCALPGVLSDNPKFTSEIRHLGPAGLLRRSERSLSSSMITALDPQPGLLPMCHPSRSWLRLATRSSLAHPTAERGIQDRGPCGCAFFFPA